MLIQDSIISRRLPKFCWIGWISSYNLFVIIPSVSEADCQPPQLVLKTPVGLFSYLFRQWSLITVSTSDSTTCIKFGNIHSAWYCMVDYFTIFV